MSVNIGYEMAERSANASGQEWKDLALHAVYDFATKNSTFRIEDVRAAYPDLPEPSDKRAWGSVARTAAKLSIIEHDGWVKADCPKVHGNLCSQWKSLILE